MADLEDVIHKSLLAVSEQIKFEMSKEPKTLIDWRVVATLGLTRSNLLLALSNLDRR